MIHGDTDKYQYNLIFLGVLGSPLTIAGYSEPEYM